MTHLSIELDKPTEIDLLAHAQAEVGRFRRQANRQPTFHGAAHLPEKTILWNGATVSWGVGKVDGLAVNPPYASCLRVPSFRSGNGRLKNDRLRLGAGIQSWGRERSQGVRFLALDLLVPNLQIGNPGLGSSGFLSS